MDSKDEVAKSFNNNGLPINPKDRLNEQLRFFGAKPSRYVSVYAKKPRVRVKTDKDSPFALMRKEVYLNSLKRGLSVRQSHAQYDALIAARETQRQALGEVGMVGMARAMGSQPALSALSGMSGTANNGLGW